MSQMTTRDDVTATDEWLAFLAATSDATLPCLNGSEWTSDDERQQQRASELCGGCSALIECRAYAIAANERHSVLGGLTATQRKRARRQQRGAA